MKYQSTKTYGHETGLSCCFRQHKAKSHCRYLHGYALSFKFTFEADKLDDNGWVVDFGGLKDLYELLKYWFDHTVIMAHDEPWDNHYAMMGSRIADIRRMHGVGCEAFAEFAHSLAEHIISVKFPHARVVSCEVAEHGGNSAIYFG